MNLTIWLNLSRQENEDTLENDFDKEHDKNQIVEESPKHRFIRV